MTGHIGKLWLPAAAFVFAAASVTLAHDPQKKSAMDEVCGEHHSAAMKASEQTSMHLAEARRAGTLAEMRKHVEAAEKAHAEMTKHLSTCMGMMDEMHGGMMGEGKGTMGGMMSGKSPTPTTGSKVIDPVCGMEVDPATAPKATYAGKTYYFCSEDEKAKFQKNPEQYVRKSS